MLLKFYLCTGYINNRREDKKRGEEKGREGRKRDGWECIEKAR